MYCRICGTTERVTYHAAQRQALCSACAKGMPAKVGRESFDRLYWTGTETPPNDAIRREFYADYLASNLNVRDYISETTCVSDM